jgi:hypothetical protein
MKLQKKPITLLFLAPLFSFLLVGCNKAIENENIYLKAMVEKLEDDVKILSFENDSLRSTAPIMYASALQMAKFERFSKAEEILETLIRNHPSSKEASNAKIKIKEIKKAKSKFTATHKQQSNTNAQSEEQPKTILELVKSEPKVKDAVITDADVLYVGVLDDGTRRNGYAEYLCQLLKDNNSSIDRVKVVRFNSHNDPNKDNAYGVLLGESWCK